MGRLPASKDRAKRKTMTHRSNQALASQERNSDPPEDDAPSPRRGLLIGWGTALAALAVSTAALALVVWMARFPIAQFFLSSALAERGVEADFQVGALEADRIVLNGVRVGSAEAPDASIATVIATWSWRGLSPEVRSVRLVEPRLRLRMDNHGRVSAGALDHVGGAPSGKRMQIPPLELVIDHGVLEIDAPFGPLTADVRASGVIGADFTATGVLRPITSARRGYAIQEAAGNFVVASHGAVIAARLDGELKGMLWADARASDVALRAVGRAPLDLSRYELDGAWRLGVIRTPALSADAINGAAHIVATTRDDSLLASTWRGRVQAGADRFAFADASFANARINTDVGGREMAGRGRWTIAGENFSGFSLASERATASGALTLDLRGAGQADASGVIDMEGAKLSASARRAIDGMLPNLSGAPLAPTFAEANAALKRGGSNFTLTAPIAAHFDAGAQRIVFDRPIAARAASGLRFSLAPLRVDAPAMTLEWPGAALHGAVDVELSGGGAPSASMLLDAVRWTPGAPLEGDGTLALSHWSSDGASLSADQLEIGISIGRGGAGRVDLRGAAKITGPFGSGQVRDMVANLDIGILWGGGWRVVATSGCLPISLGGLDVAGLSFERGGL